MKPVSATPVIDVSSPFKVYLPSEEWRETFEYRFQNFRKVAYLRKLNMFLIDNVSPTAEFQSADSSCWYSQSWAPRTYARQKR